MQPSRHDAQIEADRLNAFRAQLAELERNGVLQLSPEQHGNLNRYIEDKLAAYRQQFDIDTTAGARQLSWGLRIASTLGGLSLCAAVILLFQRYWGSMSPTLQTTIVILAPLLALAGTEFAARKERTLYFAALLSLVAFACFVMNLVVIGEIFNFISTHNAFLAWGLFALALAYHYGLRIQLIIGLVASLSWLSAQITHMRGYHWFAFGERPEHFLVSGLVIFALPFVLRHPRNSDFPAVYRFTGMIACYLSLLSLMANGHFSYLPLSSKAIETFYEITGLVLGAAAVWFGIRRSWIGVVYTSAGFFTLFLYIRLFRWLWDWLPSYVMFAAVGAIAIAVMYVLKRLRSLTFQEAL